MKPVSLEIQRKRLENIEFASKSINKCQRRIRIHDYIPGQVTYNLGPYPSRFSIEPTQYDYDLLKSFAESGVGLIQIHEEWNDHIRRFGADKYSSHDPQGLKNFVKLCHDFGIKVLPYMSTGFFDVRDPDFKKEFMRYEGYEFSVHYQYAKCSPSSPEWSTFLLNKISGIIEEYGFDGLYNDSGSEEYAKRHSACRNQGRRATQSDIQYDSCEEDLFARIYSLVKEYGGIMKMHYAFNTCPVTTEKVYDYLWVGEGITDGNTMVATAEFEPYIVPCPDFRRLEEESDIKKVYARSIPFMQFPLRPDGRPFNAEKIISVPDIEYIKSSMYDYYLKMAEYDKSHPNGPYAYSDWSKVPDDEEYRRQWFYYLDLYKPMTAENNICHMNISDSTLTNSQLGNGVYMTMFTGDEIYLCVSNLNDNAETVVFNHTWQNRETNEISNTFKIDPNNLILLKKV